MMQLPSKDIFEDPNITDFDLFPFQATAVQWMRHVENKILNPGEMAGGVLADDMGFGKTMMMSALCESNIVPTTLIIAPLSVINPIAFQLLKISKRLKVFKIDDHKFFSIMSIGMKDGIERVESTKLYENKKQNFDIPGVLLINREKLIIPENINLIKRFNWYRIMVDEAHMMRHGEDTTFYKPLLDIPQPMTMINGVPFRVGSRFAITGTPIQNDIDDLVQIFKFVDQRCHISQNNKEQDLRRLIMTNLFRRNKDQIIPSMKRFMKYPEKPPNVHNVTITLRKTELSDQLEKLNLQQIESLVKTSPEKLTQILYDEKAFMICKTAQIANETTNVVNPYKTMLSYPYKSPLFTGTYKGHNSKLEVISNIIASKNGESFVIFHMYNSVRDALAEFLPQIFPNYKFLSISGEQTKMDDRDRILLEANHSIDDGRSVILFSSIKATAEGLNYQKFSNEIIVDHNANPQEEFQTMNRVYRIGQKNEVHIWILSLETFTNGYGIVGVDDRYKEIKSHKVPQAEIIESNNAAWFFRRYTYPGEDGQRESGVFFHPTFERDFKGQQWGPDSVGPKEIV